MVKIFLDANVFYDLMEKRNKWDFGSLHEDILLVSVESVSIWLYIAKHKMPRESYVELFNQFNFLSFTDSIARKAFLGPTNDYEDNIQLHTAVESDADVFVTKDKNLLKMAIYGKVRIVDHL